ncbi:restriction endonuclease subunit S [Thiothrix litoralis]|uniref:Restriction endonuclease subunit S n=1 Tax=Thiothrix litoralis TaxID=2891210 RepID=A0ABX7WSQ5_9GAMM|nr:restriction endonuclease subunit S [Thiothrix litoralis]QTR45523.1 restriction endonuclease subunit S [Thiothrix litoralis]
MPNYRPYPDYQPSGIDWLGNIPQHWQVKRVKDIAEIVNGYPFDSEKFDTDNGIPLIRIRNIFGENIDLFWNQKAIPDAEIKNDDILIGMDGDFNVAWWNRGYAMLNQRICAIRTNTHANQKLLFYFLPLQLKRINDLTYSTTVKHLSSIDVGKIRIALPDANEQQQIAAFLDRETAKIDQLIAKQQQLIELLKEKRQAVISHAVTKGLNPDVKMQPSGVEWLGDVPEHWDIRSVSRLSSKITNGYVGPTRDILVSTGVPYVQATHIKNGKVNFDDAYFVREAWSNSHAKSILKEGDVLIVQTGAGTGDVGIVTKDEEGFNCHALIILQPINEVISGEFLSTSLQSQYGYSVLYSIRTGGMHPHLNCGEVQYVKLPIPSRVEQDAIIQYLRTQNEKFDVLMEKAQRQIGLLRERRAALISAAVTGKIDVREVALLA